MNQSKEIENDLNDEIENIKFYEKRYAKGYMEEWPVEKKSIVKAVISDLNLPLKGDALDFGCGNGVFTQVLQEVHPTS